MSDLVSKKLKFRQTEDVLFVAWNLLDRYFLVTDSSRDHATASKEQRKFSSSDKNQPCASARSFRPFFFSPKTFDGLIFFTQSFSRRSWITSEIKLRKRCFKVGQM